MKSSPIVTVLIPTYNRSECLKFAIKSVLWQTLTDFEVLVIGDKCTDNSEEVVNSFNDSRLKWYNLPVNSGYQSEPNNEGMRRAEGKYIAYLNHDDLWLPNHLETLVKHIQETKSDFVYSILEWVYSHKDPRADIPPQPYMPRTPEATAVLHTKEIINKIGYWKQIHETYSFPRVEYFRQVVHQDLNRTAVPALTCLKFLWDDRSGGELGAQEHYYNRVLNEKDFIEKELATLLVKSEKELESVISFKRFKLQLVDKFRAFIIVKFKMDPAALFFWERKGKKIKMWHKIHYKK